jgi:hypothetical protein
MHHDRLRRRFRWGLAVQVNPKPSPADLDLVSGQEHHWLRRRDIEGTTRPRHDDRVSSLEAPEHEAIVRRHPQLERGTVVATPQYLSPTIDAQPRCSARHGHTAHVALVGIGSVDILDAHGEKLGHNHLGSGGFQHISDRQSPLLAWRLKEGTMGRRHYLLPGKRPVSRFILPICCPGSAEPIFHFRGILASRWSLRSVRLPFELRP